jgi:hypothetical protein
VPGAPAVYCCFDRPSPLICARTPPGEHPPCKLARPSQSGLFCALRAGRYSGSPFDLRRPPPLGHRECAELSCLQAIPDRSGAW